MSDPRIYFAAERTLLAWVRTGIAVMGLGFVVARFGLFMRLAGDIHPSGTHGLSVGMGVGFVLLGSSIIVHSTLQFRRFVRDLPESELPEGHRPRISVASTFALAAAGLLLAVYLLI
jgi:putative membrane protein